MQIGNRGRGGGRPTGRIHSHQKTKVASQTVLALGFHPYRRVISKPEAARPLWRAFTAAAIHHSLGMTVKYQRSVPRAAGGGSKRGQPRARELERGNQNRGTEANWLTRRLWVRRCWVKSTCSGSQHAAASRLLCGFWQQVLVLPLWEWSSPPPWNSLQPQGWECDPGLNNSTFQVFCPQEQVRWSHDPELVQWDLCFCCGCWVGLWYTWNYFLPPRGRIAWEQKKAH